MSDHTTVMVGRRGGNRTETCHRQTASVLDGPLSGYTIGVTADRRREEQAELLTRRGAEVLLGPVLVMAPLGDERELVGSTQALIADPPAVVVLSTALGVRTWFSAAAAAGLLGELHAALASATIVARGAKAAGAAVAEGLQIDWTSPRAVSAEVVDHLAAQFDPATTGSRRPRLALQVDGAKSVELADALGEMGYEVVPVQVYGYTTPGDSSAAERLVLAAADRQLDAVTFTSAPAVASFAAIAERLGVLQRIAHLSTTGVLDVVCVGPVTAESACSFGLVASVESRRPRLGAMVNAVVDALSSRRQTLDLSVARLSVQGSLVAVDGGTPVRLPGRERALLGVLARNPGAVVSKQSLLEEVWSGESDDHVVEVTVARLRRRLGVAGLGIETVVRRGYRLATR